MKNASLVIVSALIGFLALTIVMTVGGYMNRRVELQSSLSAAMEQTVEQMTAEWSGGDSAWAVVAECMEILSVNADTSSAMEIRLYGADAGKGILAMKVQEQFAHPNGMEASTAWERTVIYDRREEEKSACYEIRFYRSKADMLGEQKCYKEYTVQEGQSISAPAEPSADDARFAGWRDLHDYMADFSQPVEQSRSYYADWE